MILDPALRDLLTTISGALGGVANWRAAAISVAVDRVLAGDDPGAEADWLARFLAEREAMKR